jgi:uncharacterized protein (TIGR00369 family)
VPDSPDHAGGGEDAWGRSLGLEFLEVSDTRVVAKLEAGPQHHQPYGILHGGVYCSIVEGVASYGAGQVSHALGQGVVGVSNQTDFLRSHSAGRLDVVGEPIHLGRTQQIWEVRITRARDGKLVARGQVRFAALSQLPAERAAKAGSDPAA